jgi:hypothetical protein
VSLVRRCADVPDATCTLQDDAFLAAQLLPSPRIASHHFI